MSLTNNTDPTQRADPGPREQKDVISDEPSLSELLGAAQQSDPASDGAIDDTRQRFAEQKLKESETERLGVQKYYELRDKWSVYIHGYVWAMLAFQFLLTISIGFGWLDFSKYSFFINLVIGQNFAQVVGMGVIVAKFLFSSPKKEH